VFVDDADRRAFLAALHESAVQHRVAVEAYALADSHVHLLLRPGEAAGLSAVVQGLGRRHVAQFNRRHGRSGTLWAGRFRAAVLQPGERVLQALQFIDQHAWRHGLVAQAEDDLWSSARHHLGRQRDLLLSDGPDWWALGNTPFEREAAYRQRLSEPLPASAVRALADASHKGWALGDSAWLGELARLAPRPLVPRPRGRPRGKQA
jgi:putative transposase